MNWVQLQTINIRAHANQQTETTVQKNTVSKQ